MVIQRNNINTSSKNIKKIESPKKEENILRPKTLNTYIGQKQIKENLNIFIKAANKRWDPLEHLLFYGPPWLWKTTIANVIANEMWVNIKTTSWPAIEKSWDLASILSNLKENDILFIDEIHRLKTTMEEILYSAMEDFSLDIVIWKWPGARNMRLNLPKFTLIWATTKVGSLSAPFRDRFGSIFKLKFYSTEEMSEIINRSAKILEIGIDEKSTHKISKCSRSTPRISNRLLKRVRDFASINNKEIDIELTNKSLKSLWVDDLWLDDTDRELLETIIKKFNWWPVGLATIAAATAEDKDTIEEVYEPYLLQIWFLDRSPRGRVATKRAYQYFGIENNNRLF